MKMISELLTRYDSGTLTRRELIIALTMLAVTGRTASAAGLRGIKLDHVALQVADLKRSRDFYVNVLGLSENTNPRPDSSIRVDLPESGYLTLQHFSPGGKVDHFALKLEGFNKESVTRQLKEHGIVPIDQPSFTSGGAGFHVIDPDGFKVQLSR